MSEKDKFKIALILEGPGFYDQSEIDKKLVALGYQIVRKSLNFEAKSFDCPEFKTASFILLRGPWSKVPEELLLCRNLAERLKKSLTEFKGAPHKDQVLIGVGRGALILMLSGIFNGFHFENYKWKNLFRDKGPWVETHVAGATQVICAQILGRAKPEIDSRKVPGLTPWLMCENETVGWCYEKKFFLSLVDILAYAERTQLSNYGYEDLSHIATQSQVLAMLKEKSA